MGAVMLCAACLTSFAAGSCIAQRSGTDQASLLLDLKKAQAAYETAKEQFENDSHLFEQKAISKNDFDQSRNNMLTAQVEYQKLILKVMSEQSYIVVKRATKYQTGDRTRKVKVLLQSTASGNKQYLDMFRKHKDIFTAEMRPDKVYNIFVSLLSLEDQTIIGDPYEAHVPSIALGQEAEVDFTLLKDVESLQILLNYGDHSQKRNVYLQQDASADIVDVSSVQFSQEANLGGRATYDLNLERFSSGDDVYKLAVLGLPRQVSYEFSDPQTGARLSQVSFAQGVSSKRLSLTVYLPDRTDEKVVIDQQLRFFALVVSQEYMSELQNLAENAHVTEQQLNTLNAGRASLELIPRGVGRIEVMAPTLYHEIKTGQKVNMSITVKNTGTRRLDNIRITSDNPLRWTSDISPDLIPSLGVEEEATVDVTLIPPDDVGVGAQEVKIKTDAMADNRPVQTEDKTVRIQISARTPLFGTFLIVLILVGLLVGIVYFGIRLSRR